MQEAERFGDFTTIAREGRVVLVEFSRGDGMNALSIAAMRELTALARHLSEDTASSAIVLTGGGGAFSAGADLKDPEAAARRDLSLIEQRQALKVGPDMCAAWESLEQVTVAAIEQFCIGGGVALAAACDHRIAGKSAHLRLPEVPLGMNMSWHSNPRLVNLMGPSKAKLFTILGEKLSAGKAEAWGLVDEVSADGKACEAALDLARRIGALPPLGVRMSKQSIDMAAKALNQAVTFMDRDQFALAAGSEDQREAIKAFLEKRPASFKGN
ncbi:enoyl-CoA hydratase/isomerase family protein [Tepidicaulis sp.]|uniref:enoyl-CoA hydratase/isomerase family protein n=1 Tax=Tepidicaulis sp. TaxID=1920809 RepID=UPI003B5B2043